MLIESPRHTAADLRHWYAMESLDARVATSRRFLSAVSRAVLTVETFAASHSGAYASISWGKDSVVVAHMAHMAGLPLRHLRWDPLMNPDSYRVRDAFLSSCPSAYEELNIPAVWQGEAGWLLLGITDRWATMSELYGSHRIVGVRGTESADRARSAKFHGATSGGSCRPLIDWPAEYVYAYLYLNRLPVHPAYACTFGGSLDRMRLRVGDLGGNLGTGVGRADWERRYYSDELEAVRRLENDDGSDGLPDDLEL
jgi:phosphoadenosine phosphosulfate reductase